MKIPDMLRSLRIAITMCISGILFLTPNSISGQQYFVTQENNEFYIEFESPTDVTIADNDTQEIPIGFDFTFFDSTYSTCYLSENGFIQFGDNPDNGCCEGKFLPSDDGTNNLIAALWMGNTPTNCCYNGEYYSVFQYETIGSTPNRVFLVTFELRESCGTYYYGQIKLYEGSNIIEIHSDYFADGESSCNNVSQGIENIDGTEAYLLPGRNASSWNIPCCGDVVRFTPWYDLPQNDAGVAYIFNSPPCEGTQPIDVLVTNFGVQPLDSVVLDWTWDNVPQDSLLVEINSPILHGESRVFEIGSQTFVSGEAYDITAWTSLPNGEPDDLLSNDTLTSIIKTGVRDTFTIGGASPDFATFSAAISFLETTGVCDTTWMLVRPGTYNEQINIPWIPGAAYSQIIFKAENGDSSSVIIEYDPNMDDRYVVRLNNAAGITLEYMTINALGTDYGRVVQLSLYSFDNLIQHCAINGINTSNTGHDFSCICSNAFNTGNIFQFNTIRYGSIGVHQEIFDDNIIIGLQGTATRAQQGSNNDQFIEGVEIRNNIIEDFSYAGILSYETEGVQMVHNQITSDKDLVYGILLIQDPDTFCVSNNQISLSNGRNGIELSSIYPTHNSSSQVFNNMVFVHHPDEIIRGIYSNTVSKADIFNNTIKVSGPNTSNYAIELDNGQQDSIFNNLFVSEGGSPAFYIGGGLLSMMNFNGYYHTGSILGLFNYGGNIVANLEEWQALTGFDTDAVFNPPYFQSDSNLHMGNPYFSGRATAAWAPIYDIDGELRNTTHPDIGADEFDPEPLDASIASLVSPLAICDTTQDIKVVLINLGTDTITDAVIHWTRNGMAQTPVNFNGSILPEGDTAQVLLQTLVLFDGQPDTLLFWAEALNGDDDMFMANDTLEKIYRLPMSGSYTIGGSNPDFTSINEAVTAMQTFSICGPVTFELRNGTYTEQFTIESIAGSSATNTITFTSEALDSSSVTIQFDATSDANYIVNLDGAKHIRFEHLGFKTLNTTYANIFYLKAGSGDIDLAHCYLEGCDPAYYWAYSSLFLTDYTFEGDVSLQNNYFLNGIRGISLLGSYTPAERQDSFVIEDNQFVNQRSGAILVQQVKDISIERNSVISNTTASYTGIALSSSHGTNTVASNKINLTATGDGININGVNSTGDLPGLCKVYNNMSTVVNGSAFSLSGNRRLNFVYNTGYSAGTVASSNHAITLFGGDSITVKNNIAVANQGRAYSEGYYIPVVRADHNNYFTSGTQLAYRANVGYADLASWQAGTALDSNSFSVDPFFVSNADLHIFSSVLNGVAVPVPGITVDIDGQMRDTTTPDIGADEIGTESGDAGIIGVLPDMPFARGLQDVKAIIRNFGSDTLSTAVISWALNGVPQPDYYYNSELPSLGEDTIILGSLNFELSTAYQFKIWTSLPNQGTDSTPLNDTLDQSAIYPAVSGAVAVGSTGEVLTIGGAINAMTLGGILDSVQFEIQTGTYHEAISLDAAPFLSCATPVIFTSVTGNAADVIWDNMGTGTHTVLFNGADGIEFRNLTIKTVINAFQAIRFQNASTCNTIDHCYVEGVTTTNNSSTYAVILGSSTSSTNYNHNNTIQYSTISKGSYNIYWDGATGTTGLTISHNILQNAYYSGLFLYKLKAPRALNNTVTTNSAIGTFVGIYGGYCSENTSITANKILLHGRRFYGIQFEFSNGTALLRTRIANNFIIGGQGASSYGLYTNTCTYFDVYHNTIRISGGGNTGINILRHYGGNFQYLNNILDNQANGKTMQFNGGDTPLTTDYNTHYTEGTNLINYLGTNYTTLALWQATGRDVNSQYVEPSYEGDPLSYEINNAEMNGSATPGTNTPEDIEGRLRDVLTPDIGCDEFDLFTHDVGISGITYPYLPFPEGINTVYIKFINNGIDTLTSMEVNWEVDSVLQPSYMWTGLLPSAATYDSLDIGEYNFIGKEYHKIKVWVSEPNGMQDELASNDTLKVDSLYPGLHGIYTIGGNNPDFVSIHEAVDGLNIGGASGSVTFNIRSGTYLDTLLIRDFPGSDCARPVIFQSESGNREDVLISNLGYDAHTIVLNGADGVIFQNLTIASVNPAYRHVVSYYNGANCNHFINNIITGLESTNNYYTDAVIYSATGLDTQNVFSNNLIRFGSHSFYLYGAANGVSGTVIEGNTLDLPYFTGILAWQENNIAINHNTINIATVGAPTGIALYYSKNVESVSENIIHLPHGGNGLYVEDCDNLVSAPGLISNNMINIGGSSFTRGMYFNGSSYYNILHNTIHVYSTHSNASATTPFYLTSCPSLNVYNNICSNAGQGYAIFSNNNTSFSADNNDYFFEGLNMGYWDGTARATLSDWRTASGQDQNAVDFNPQFVSDGNLHVSNILIKSAGVYQSNVTHDIDGDIRNNPPDIGADEFYPSIANDAGIFMAIGPKAPFASGNQPIEVVIKNYGVDTLTSVDVRWLVNGIEQPIYTWTGALASTRGDTVIIGNYSFPKYTAHDLMCWTESPNHIPDSASVNDTIHLTNLYPALSGLYTVGGVLPDFNLFSQLENALRYGGILGDVTFSIRNGTYAAQLLIQNFPRISLQHTVTFTAESGDSSAVSLTRNFVASTANNFTVRLKNAHGIRFENMTLASTKGRVLEMMDGSSDIGVSYCRITGVQLQYAYEGYELVYSGTTSEDSISITNNYFEYGGQGIYLIGSPGDPENHHIISNNYFYNNYSRSVYSTYAQNLQISNNTIVNTANYSNGIFAYFITGNSSISGNDIRFLAGGNYGINIYSSYGTSSLPLQVNNNYILARNSPHATYGIQQQSCDYVNYNYNTVRLENVNASSIAFVDNYSYHHIHILNCIFSNESGGKAMLTSWSPYYTDNTVNHCNLYTTGPVLAYFFSDLADLQAFQTATNQNLQGVSIESLFDGDGPDVSQAALDGTASPVAGITTDIYGDVRMVTTPDIGAREFTLLAHDIGAKLLAAPETYCGFGNEVEVTIRIQNYGANEETGFDVGYSMDGAAWVIENVGSLLIEPGGTLDYTFTATEDMSIPGPYTFALYNSLSADLDPGNDTLWNVMVEHIPVLIASATNLIPVDQTVDLNSNVSLSWSPAQHATKYDVYVWPSTGVEPSIPQISNITQINTVYQNLNYGLTYSWKVVAKNICNQQVASNTQEFTIRNLPDLVIDTVIAPPVVFSGQNIELNWIVRNLGPGGTQSTIWSDAVYLSTDATLNLSLDTYLGAIQNLTALDSGEAYLQTGVYVVPNGYAGNYYVFVTSDRWTTLLETNNNNNATRTLGKIEIQPSPLPDLKVQMVAAPSSTFSGQTVTLQYEVKNIGLASTTLGAWYDRIIFSQDPENYAGGIVIGTFLHQGVLGQDSSYLRNVSVPIPPSVFGDRYLYVVTDWFGAIFEGSAENNNVGRSDTMEVILLPPPDLITTEISIADTLHNNQYTPMYYVFENQGGSTINTSSWQDQLYFSQAPIYNDNFVINAGTKVQYGPLAAFEPQISSLSVLTPLSATGEYYLYIASDKQNYVFEHENESNNIKRTVNALIFVNPDLAPENLFHVDTALSGAIKTIEWDLINYGPGHLINRNISHSIYISTQAIFNPETATLLSQFNTVIPLLSAYDTLHLQTSATLPNGWEGDAYYYVVTNSNNLVFENGHTANNVSAASLIFLELPAFPDIYARQIQVPDTVSAGESFIINYEDYNGGNAALLVSSTDSIFMSFSPVWNPGLNIPLGKISGVNPLMPLDSQALQFQILLPVNQASNQYYIYIKADATNVIFENDGEANNIQRSDTFFVNPPRPLDLKLVEVEFNADTMWSGVLSNLYFTTENIGQRHVSSPSWMHAMYLSVDSILHEDLDYRFGQKNMSSVFLPAGSFRRDTVMGIIPRDFSGDYYMIGRTDDLETLMDIDYTNNIKLVRGLSAAKKVHIKLSPSPDLIIYDFVAPETAFSGQPFSLTMDVRNIGTGTATDHQIRIYLSADEQIGTNDILLESRMIQTPLDTGSSYIAEFNLVPPITSFGNYFLILQIDASNQLFEYLGENNNIQLRTITIVLPPPSDLIIQAIALPDTVYAGDTATVSWQTLNIGSNPSFGVFREIVYFSEDTLLDVADRVFGILDNNDYINPGGSIFRSFNGPLNGLSNLDYYAIVQTDARNNIPEVSEENNLENSESKIHITIEPLHLDSLTPGMLPNGRERYYKLDIPFGSEGENLQITLTGDTLALYNEIYLKFGEVPTPANFDANHLYAFEPNQELIFEDIQGGTYYIMIRGYTQADSQQHVHILARLIDFELLAVKPNKLKRQAQTTIELFGTQMDSLRNVYIVRDSTIRIHADSVYSINSSRAYATFTIDSLPFYGLDEIPLGVYDVQAERWDGKLAELGQCVEITDIGSEADLQFVMEYPSTVRRWNRPIKITIFFQNSGDADLVGQSFLFEAPFGNIVANSYEELISTAEGTSIVIPVQGAFGPTGILPPKAINIIEVFSYTNPHPTFVITPINN